MEQYPENYTKQLQRILLIINDGKEGYAKAAEQATSNHLRELFISYSNQRRDMALELKEKIEKMGGKAENNEGDKAGSVHRAMMSFKTAFTSDKKDDQAILETCRTGEQAALDVFDDILQGSILETDLKGFITGLRMQVSQAYYEMDKLYFERFNSSPEV